MDPTLQAFLAALMGAVVTGGAVLAWAISDRQQSVMSEPEEPVVPPAVATVLSVLRSSAVVVGEDDTVLKASAPAYAFGLVRGNVLVAEELTELVRQVRRDGQIRETELLLSRTDMPARHVTARVAPMGARLVLALIEDRTRERRVEAVRRDFVANVSHELKTPIGAIRLLAEAVLDAADDPEAVKRFGGRMLTESDRLTRLVQQIIELSRLQGDDPLEAPVPVSVDKVIAAAVDTSAIDADTSRISLVTGGTPGLEVFGNAEQVSAAVSNLVANAVAYSGQDSTVLVSAKPNDGAVEISVVDQGHRDPARRDGPDLRALLPDRPGPAPLHRRDRPGPLDRQARRGHPRRRRTRVVGRGAGIHLHPDPAPPLLRPGTGDQHVTRVLVVEDEESYSDALAYMLRKEGYEVALAATGPDALTEFDRNGADVVLLDLMLPGLPGTEVCRQIRQTSNVPVIMVSAKDDEVDKVVGLELGADDYVTKPYSPRELVARIRAVLRRGVDPDLAPMTLEAGPVRMDVERHVVTVDGSEQRLPLKEFELLEMFLRNPGRVLTRGQLIDRVWGSDYVGDTKTLDVHVKRLRAKLEPDPSEPKMLVTVRGLGYKLDL